MAFILSKKRLRLVFILVLHVHILVHVDKRAYKQCFVPQISSSIKYNAIMNNTFSGSLFGQKVKKSAAKSGFTKTIRLALDITSVHNFEWFTHVGVQVLCMYASVYTVCAQAPLPHRRVIVWVLTMGPG